MRAKIDSDTMNIMTLFEKVTGARLKDCLVKDSILFVVHPNQSGKAIGKNGSNIKKVQYMLKKKALIREFSEDKLQFVKNLIGFEVESVEEIDGIVEIKCKDNKTKNMLIGRNKNNINFIEQIVKRHFDVNGLRVV